MGGEAALGLWPGGTTALPLSGAGASAPSACFAIVHGLWEVLRWWSFGIRRRPSL